MTKIMLVEDDNNLREIYEARLTAEGYELVSAQDGEAALAIAAKERPDMIISDVMMPKISGFEMLDILRNTESLRNVKIIMLTALGQAEDSSRANALGADRYLVKSQVTLEDIVKAAHELLDGPNAAPDTAAAPAEASPTEESPAVPAEPAAENFEIPEPAIAAERPAAPAAAEPFEPAEPVQTIEPVEPPALDEPAVPASSAEPSQPDAAAQAPESAPEAPEPALTETAEPAEPAQPVEPEPSPEPAAPAEPAVPRSIPVQVFSDSSDSGDPADASGLSDSSASPTAGQTPADLVQAPPADDTAQQAAAPVADESAAAGNQPELHPISNLPVTPEPQADSETAEPGASAGIPVIPPPVPDEPAPSPDEGGQPSEPQGDYTSPDSFNNFQASPSEPAPTPEPSPDLDLQPSAADEESAIKSQIDDFINTSDTEINGPLEVTARPDQTSDIPNEPVAEELGEVAPPVIEAPVNSSVPEPVPVAVSEEQFAPAGDNTSTSEDDELIAAAAEDLSDNGSDSAQPSDTPVSEEPQAAQDEAEAVPSNPSTDVKMRTVTPLAAELQPSIHQLLELEESKNSATQAAAQNPAPAPGSPGPNIDAYNPTANTGSNRPAADSDDPDSISL